MTFDDILEQAIGLLRRRGRLTYRTLKRQFDLDDEALEDLKEQILYSQPQVVDDGGKGFIWAGDPAASEAGVQRGTEAEARFQTALPAVIGLLQRDMRVTYRTLKWTFGVDDALLEEIRKELALKRLAIDEGGEVLVWTGETQPAPTRIQADESRGDRQKVTERLSELGMSESSARVHAAQLTDAVAAHYAGSPVVLQIVAGLHTDEVLFGTLYLMIIGVALNRLDQRPEDS